MLRITTETKRDTFLVTLEGSLSGPWVEEFDRTLACEAENQASLRVQVDLTAVTFISSDGKALLRRLSARGVDMFSTDVETKAIIDEIRWGKD